MQLKHHIFAKLCKIQGPQKNKILPTTTSQGEILEKNAT